MRVHSDELVCRLLSRLLVPIWSTGLHTDGLIASTRLTTRSRACILCKVCVTQLGARGISCGCARRGAAEVQPSGWPAAMEPPPCVSLAALLNNHMVMVDQGSLLNLVCPAGHQNQDCLRQDARLCLAEAAAAAASRNLGVRLL